jgi:hypothetical protein
LTAKLEQKKLDAQDNKKNNQGARKDEEDPEKSLYIEIEKVMHVIARLCNRYLR